MECLLYNTGSDSSIFQGHEIVIRSLSTNHNEERSKYLTIILRGRAGYRMIDNQRGA